MGDINCFQSTPLMQAVLAAYKGRSVRLPALPPALHLVPVFLPHSRPAATITAPELWGCARRAGALPGVLCFTIDPKDTANPAGGVRLCNFVVSDLTAGMAVRDAVLAHMGCQPPSTLQS